MFNFRYLLILFCMLQLNVWSRNYVVVPHPEIPKSEKEALLILVGFGSKTHHVKHIAQYFSNKGYDLYQPDYICRKSIQKGVNKVDAFAEKHDLKAYKKIHVFCYIIGGWTFNTWFAQHPLPNIASVIYDRSPLQERAPYALVKDIPFLIGMLVGDVMQEFAGTPYQPLQNSTAKVGLLIETIPTKLILKHKKTAALPGPINWDPAALNQPCDDYCFVPMNHDDFYVTFDGIGSAIFQFIREGKFDNDANRTEPENDPLTP